VDGYQILTLQLVAEGKTSKRIAVLLGPTVKTAESSSVLDSSS
jgi:DNA-binding CsgD family transcriptional regulator